MFNVLSVSPSGVSDAGDIRGGPHVGLTATVVLAAMIHEV